MKWFIGVILFLLAALILQSGLLAYAMYVLLAVMVLSRVLARSWIGKVTAKRFRHPSTAEIGDKLQVTVKVHNSGALPVPWILLEDLISRQALDQKPPRLKIEGKRLQIRMLWSGSDAKLKYEIDCRMRGYYQIGPLVLESGDVFGLHRRYRIDADPHFLTVYPKVVPLEGYDIASRRPIGDVKLTHRLFEDPTRIAGVRPYEAGDPLNRVPSRTDFAVRVLHFPSTCVRPLVIPPTSVLHNFALHRLNEPCQRGRSTRPEILL